MPDHAPEFDKLVPSVDGECKFPGGQTMIEISYDIATTGADDVQCTDGYRLFHRYKWERVRARDKRAFEDKPTGATRVVNGVT